MDISNKTPQRVRHQTRVRLLDVIAVTDVTPLMRRVTLAGADLAGFTSLGYDDHVKVFFFPPGVTPVKPEVRPEGLAFEDDVPRPEMRDYTPRRYDPVAGTLDIDFVLHGDGPASGWAADARVGQKLLIGGPRGSMIVPDTFDWYLLVGDETALPAIGRRIEELPAGKKVVAIVEVAGPAEQQVVTASSDVTTIWAHRNGAPAGIGDMLLDAVKSAQFPEGDCFAFIAGESSHSKAIRAHLEGRGFARQWIKAAGYWVLGQADAHEPH